MLRRPTLTLAVLAGTGLAGCTLLYPRFDSLLNPDLAFLNAGDVVDSVKCAVTTFFINHRTDIERDARLELQSALKKVKNQHEGIEGRNFCPSKDKDWTDDWTDLKKDPKKWRVAFFTRGDTGEEKCRFDDSLILQANDADKSVTVLRNGIPERETIPGGGDLAGSLKRRFKDTLLAAGDCQGAVYRVYKYIKVDKGQCVPNGGCRPGTFFRGDKKCGLEDAGRKLVIDPDSDAAIDLTLTAVNTGSMNYQRIDATRLDILGGIIVPGGVAGAAFPALKATDKKTNKVEISLVMPQGRIQEDKAEGFIVKLTKAIDKATRELLRAKLEEERRRLGVVRDLQREDELRRLGRRLEELRRQVREKLVEDESAGQYKERCESNRLKVGYLGLANYIDKIVNEQGERIYEGSPDVSLDKLVLTSQFQISFDATAGTQNLLRIVPVLQPPVLQLNPDHTHALKITLKGNKGRPTKAKALSILRKCLSRLENTPASTQAADYCNTPQAILLESLIDAVENKSSSSAN